MGMVKRGKSDYLDNLKSASSKEFWKAVKNLNGRQCSIPTLKYTQEKLLTLTVKKLTC